DGDEPATVTDADGSYTFFDLEYGQYTLRQIPPDGHHITEGQAGYPLTISSGVPQSGLDFGHRAGLPGPDLILSDASVVEGDSGTTDLVFTVSIDEAQEFDITFNWTIADGTATSADGDYTMSPASGSRTIPAGSTSATITVPVQGDGDVE